MYDGVSLVSKLGQWAFTVMLLKGESIRINSSIHTILHNIKLNSYNK